MDNIKKFEDFLDRMQGLLDNAKKQGHIIVRVEDLENTFPELKESEDERIRKVLIDYFDDANKADENPLQSYGIHTDKAIAWLEKQTTPQVRTGLEWLNTIDDACDKRYSEEYAHGEYCHEQSFKWGFQEGVDWLEKQGEPKSYWKPTKEQYEALDYAYNSCSDTERGNYYEGVLETLIEDLHRLEKQGEPVEINPTEFDTRLQALIGKFDSLPKEELIGSLSFWLNVVHNDGTYKADEKKGEQKPAEWSEEDEEFLRRAIKATKDVYPVTTDWLKSIKDRVQPKQEWSEEDKKKLNRIYMLLAEAADEHAFSTTCRLIGDNECVELQDFLKSLKPQNHWKPSDE